MKTKKKVPPTYADLEANPSPTLQDFIDYLQSIPAKLWIVDNPHNGNGDKPLKCCAVGWLGWCNKFINKKSENCWLPEGQGVIPKLVKLGVDHDALVETNNGKKRWVDPEPIPNRTKGIKKRVIEFLKSHLPNTSTKLGTNPARSES